MAKKILIVGGAGFIGSWLSHRLVKMGYEVSVIDHFKCFSGMEPDMIQKIADFRKKELLGGVKIYNESFDVTPPEGVSDNEPDIVIHLAAVPLEKPKDEAISNNQLISGYKLNRDVISWVKRRKIPKFLYLSSVLVYGNFDDFSISEKEKLDPVTPYGIAKASGEFLTRTLLENDWKIIRATNVYGFGDNNLRATQIFINKALKGEKFWVNDAYWNDLVYIDDLVDGIIKVLFSFHDEQTFHISGGKAIKLSSFVNELKPYFPNMKYEIVQLYDRPVRGTMNISKARVLLGWEPKHDLKSGVKKYMKYVKKYGFG